MTPELITWWDRMLAIYCQALMDGMGVYDPVTIQCYGVGLP